MGQTMANMFNKKGTWLRCAGSHSLGIALIKTVQNFFCCYCFIWTTKPRNSNTRETLTSLSFHTKFSSECKFYKAGQDTEIQTGNDSQIGPQIPWVSWTANDSRREPQVIPSENEEWYGVWFHMFINIIIIIIIVIVGIGGYFLFHVFSLEPKPEIALEKSLAPRIWPNVIRRKLERLIIQYLRRLTIVFRFSGTFTFEGFNKTR